MIISNNDADNTGGNTWVWKEAILFFLCGLVSDALPGFFFSSTVIKFLDIPDDNSGVLALYAGVGGLLGALTTTFLLSRLVPDARVAINAFIQILGILLSWFLPYPSNCIAGISILTFGFVGTLTTIMPLSTLTGAYATKSFQFGYSVAPILGISLVKIGRAAHFNKNQAFSVVLAFPFVSAISYFFMDHSVFFQNDNVSDSGSTLERAIISTGTTDEEGLKSSATTNPTDLTEPLLSSCQDEPQVERRASIAEAVYRRLSIQNTLGLHDYIAAMKEMMFRYWPVIIIAQGIITFWNDALSNPFFVTSSATYHGQDKDQAADTVNTISLVMHIFVACIGLSIMTCVGDAISKRSPYLLWGPAVVMITLVFTAVAGVVYGAFPPIPIPATYVICVVVQASWFFVLLYYPLFVVNDKKLNFRYREFELQSTQVMLQVAGLMVHIIDVTFAFRLVDEGCKSSYEDEYDGVSCIY